jgi:uncharacterized protein
MLLEGVVTNVTNFGAFVDIGVHQDGLVHISALSNTFVKDPHSVVKAGQVVKVKVLEVDIPRHRIALTMRLGDEVTARRRGEPAPPGATRACATAARPTMRGKAARRRVASSARAAATTADARPRRARAARARRLPRPAAANALAEAFARARGKR